MGITGLCQTILLGRCRPSVWILLMRTIWYMCKSRQKVQLLDQRRHPARGQWVPDRQQRASGDEGGHQDVLQILHGVPDYRADDVYRWYRFRH